MKQSQIFIKILSIILKHIVLIFDPTCHHSFSYRLNAINPLVKHQLVSVLFMNILIKSLILGLEPNRRPKYRIHTKSKYHQSYLKVFSINLGTILFKTGQQVSKQGLVFT